MRLVHFLEIILLEVPFSFPDSKLRVGDNCTLSGHLDFGRLDFFFYLAPLLESYLTTTNHSRQCQHGFPQHYRRSNYRQHDARRMIFLKIPSRNTDWFY